MNRASFETYVERQLAPALKPGQIVVADNLSSHKSSPALALLRAQGNDLIFLPPYSPDLNPIEMAFSKLKTVRRENDPPDRFLTLRTRQGSCQNLTGTMENRSVQFATCSSRAHAETTSWPQGMVPIEGDTL